MTDDNWIELDGAVNVRDVGGLTTGDGGRVRRQVLIRSGNLQTLTDADVRRLVDEVRVRAVADLRSGLEVRAEGPGPIQDEAVVRVVHLDLFAESATAEALAASVLPWQQREERMTADELALGTAGTYLHYLSERPDSVLAALRLIASTHGATIVHCAAGKDRTGVIVALALAEVGVPDEQIVADYVRSAERIESIIAGLAQRSTYNANYLKGVAAGTDLTKHTPRAETMQAFLDAITRRSGGVSQWLREQGWTPDDAQALRIRLLE